MIGRAVRSDTPPTVVAILAGGLARRLGGGDKSLRTVAGRTVLDRLIERLTPQSSRLVLNANTDTGGDPGRFGSLDLPIVPDDLPGNPGPLAGVLAVLDWTAATDPGAASVVTVPGDTPFLPLDLVRRLHDGRRTARFACAASGGRTHPVIALWDVSLRTELRHALVVEGVRKVGAFTGRHLAVAVEWPAIPVDPFLNVNTPEDLSRANFLAGAHPDL